MPSRLCNVFVFGPGSGDLPALLVRAIVGGNGNSGALVNNRKKIS